MQVAERQRSDEKKFFLGRIGDDVWKARKLLKKVADVDVMPTVFGDPYVVFRAEVQEFRRAKDRLSGVLWIEMLGNGEVFVSNEVQMYEAEEVREFVDPLFWMYLRGAEDVRF